MIKKLIVEWLRRKFFQFGFKFHLVKVNDVQSSEAGPTQSLIRYVVSVIVEKALKSTFHIFFFISI